jgi:hypothetical protein
MILLYDPTRTQMDYQDLEEQINNILTISDDLDLLTISVLDGELSPDEIVNITIGISSLIKLKHKRLFDTYKRVFKLDEYNENYID